MKIINHGAIPLPQAKKYPFYRSYDFSTLLPGNLYEYQNVDLLKVLEAAKAWNKSHDGHLEVRRLPTDTVGVWRIR